LQLNVSFQYRAITFLYVCNFLFNTFVTFYSICL
jgi:hypothetical protein